MAVDVGSAVGYLDLDISGFLAGLKSAQREADTTSKNIATKIGGNLSGMGKSLTSVGTTLTKNVTVPLLGVGTAGLKVATDFEKGMSQVKAISGATGKDFDALREKAIELGADTAFSANEVAEAMTEMAKAGWNSQQIIDGMEGVLAAAAASGESLATVSTIVADSITGFGLAASDSTKVADLLTQAANSGTIGITDLGESFKYIAPVASSMGLSIEDVTTAISAMSMAGIKGSQAGTSLRTMLTRMVKPTDAVAAAMDDLGIVLTNSDGSFKSLDTILAEMRTKFSGLTDEQKTYYAAVLSGQEGMSGLLSLMNLTQEEYDEIAASMDNAGGVAAETAAIMQDNLQSKVEQLGGSLESLAIKMADHVIPYLQKFVLWLTSLIDKFTALDPETQKTILKFAGIAAAAGPVLAIFGKLVTGTGNFITAIGKIPGTVSKVKNGFSILQTGIKNIGEGFTLAKSGFGGLAAQAGGFGTKMGAAMAGVTGPMLAVVAVVAVLVAAFVSLWKNNEDFRNKITAIWNQIKATFEKLTSGIVERINKLGFDFKSISEVIKAIWKGLCDFLAPIFQFTFQLIADIFDFVVNGILNTLDFWIALFTGDWEGAWNAIKSQFENIWNLISNFFSNWWANLKQYWNTILGWFGTSWSEVWGSVRDFFVNIWNSVSDFFQGVWNGISSFFVNAWEFIKGTLQSGIDFIVNLITFAFDLITLPFRFIWENCKETIMSIWETIKTAVSTAITAVQTTITNVWNAVSSFFTTIWEGIKAAFTAVWEAIKTVVTNYINAVKTTITNVFNAVKSTVTNIWNGIKNAITTPFNAAKTAITNVINSIKSVISNGFNAAKNTVTNVFNSIKNSISSVMDGAKNIIKGAIDKIKGIFNFSWSLPKLKLPHISVSGGKAPYGIGGAGSLPKFSIQWYKKAMNAGMILNSPTIFGFDAKSNSFLGGGEAGSEVVVGTKNLLTMIRESVSKAVSPIVNATSKLVKVSAELGYVTYNGFTKVKDTFDGKDFNPRPDGSGNGDIFNFYSPKAIDEIEAAKQMKKAKRDLAEGF